MTSQGCVPPFAGAVLTGGASRRMGSDKALLEFGGRPLAAVAAGALAGAGAETVLAIGGAAAELTGHGVIAVADLHPGDGPLGGVITALGYVAEGIVVVLACDLPWVGAGSVRLVVSALAGAPDALCAVPVVHGRLQPLHAAWRRTALPSLSAAFAGGERSIRRVLNRIPTVSVTGIAPAVLVDVDDPVALAAARLVVDRQDGPDCTTMSDGGQPEIDVRRLAEVQAGGAWVLDVRQPEEYQAGHVPGAHLIPLDQLSTRHTEVPTDDDVYVVCATGMRSAIATEALNGSGYRAFNVAGGTKGWIEAGHPVVTGLEPN